MASFDPTTGPAGTPSLATTLPCAAHQIGPLYAGENIKAGNPCYIKNDSTVWRSNGTAATAAAKVHGWATKDTPSGQPITLYHNVVLAWGPSTLTPGALLYVSATVGSLDDAATTGGTAPVAFVVPAPANTSPANGFIYVKTSSY